MPKYQIPKYQPDTLDDTLAERILTLLMTNPNITQAKLAECLKVSVPSVKRTMKTLSNSGKIARKGGKKYGYWEIKNCFNIKREK